MTTSTVSRIGKAIAALSVSAAILLASACGAQAPSGATGNAGSSDSSKSSSSSTTSTASGAIDESAYDELINSGAVADDATIEANQWASEVKKAGLLKVGGTKTSQLFSLQSPSDNKVRGFDAGLSQLLARYILGDAKTELNVVDSSTRETVLTNGTVNAVFATYSITDERKQKVDFAGPYYVSQQGILVAADNDDINSVKDLDGKKVGVQAGSTGPDIVADEAPGAKVQEFQTDSELVQALTQGRIDAYVVDQTLVLGDVSKNPGKVKSVGKPFGPSDPYGIGLPKGSDATEFVNAWLKKIEEDGTWAKLWKIAIGDRTGVDEDPEPPMVGLLSDLGELARDYAGQFAQAYVVMLEITALSFIGGFALGLVLSVARISPIAPLRGAVTAFVEVFRNAPVLCTLIFIVFALPEVGIVIDYLPAVVLTLVLVCAAFTCDNLAAGVNSIDPGQIEAARAIGLGFGQIAVHIVVPQALRTVIQPMTTLLISVMISSSTGAMVPLAHLELTGLVAKINTAEALGIPTFLAAALLYVATGLAFAAAGRQLEKRFGLWR